MMMSIVHRITGAALFFGLALVVFWLLALSGGSESFQTAEWIATSFIGYIIAFGFTWALIHHMLGGIRHFIWDTAKCLEPEMRNKLAWMTLIGSAGLTILIWIIGAF